MILSSNTLDCINLEYEIICNELGRQVVKCGCVDVVAIDCAVKKPIKKLRQVLGFSVLRREFIYVGHNYF